MDERSILIVDEVGDYPAELVAEAERILAREAPPIPLVDGHFVGILPRVIIVPVDRGGSRKHRSNPRRRAGRLVAKIAWKEGEAERLKQVACCPKCPTWFPTTVARDVHRYAEHHAFKLDND